VKIKRLISGLLDRSLAVHDLPGRAAVSSCVCDLMCCVLCAAAYICHTDGRAQLIEKPIKVRQADGTYDQVIT
jgi:hypothetical protein